MSNLDSVKEKSNQAAELALAICHRLEAAIDYERKHSYVNAQGRSGTFSEFIKLEASKALKYFEHSSKWASIRALMQRYPFVDVGTRIKLVKQIADNLSELSDIYQSKTRKKPTSQKKQTVTNADIANLDIQFVAGVGPSLALKLEKLNIKSCEDLLNYLPRDHISYDKRSKISELQEGEEVTIFGTVHKLSGFKTQKKNMVIVTMIIKDGSGTVKINKFFQGNSAHFYLKQYKSQYPEGSTVLVAGTAKKDKFSKSMTINNAVIEIVSEDFSEGESNIHTGRIVPIYPLTEGLSLLQLRKLIFKTLESYKSNLKEFLPEELIERYDLISYAEAIEEIHFPSSTEKKDRAAYRLLFNEFFLMQLAFMLSRQKYKNRAAGIHFNCFENGLVDEFVSSLPFPLTYAQERVFYSEILPDMVSQSPMHRLLQGDVGSGKTVVAFMSLLVAVADDYQAAIMVPTEILAEQHYKKFQSWVNEMQKQFQVRVGLLIGKQKAKEKREVLAGLANGTIDIVVGTHALIQDKVEFKKLGLIVIDEQHRFGVKQREKLALKGVTAEENNKELPNVEKLFMTATPIPRTLALTTHGDLDMSEIDEMPAGRLPVITKVVGSSKGNSRKDVYQKIREETLNGNKVYIVFPLIDESETLSAKAATTEFERLKEEVFVNDHHIKIGLVHGKQKPEERDEIMKEFRDEDTNILVATTVIEVGVDVSEATVILIESAERFGLAQLHQLRGRVGRNDKQSYCYLQSNSKSTTSLERLRVLEKSNNGFVVSQEDLRIRGAGDFLGVKQSGLPETALKGLADNEELLIMARNAAKQIIEADPELSHEELLMKKLQSKNYTENILGG